MPGRAVLISPGGKKQQDLHFPPQELRFFPGTLASMIVSLELRLFNTEPLVRQAAARRGVLTRQISDGREVIGRIFKVRAFSHQSRS